jgi:hypothetical protein
MEGQRPDGKELETRRGRKDTDRNKYSAPHKGDFAEGHDRRRELCPTLGAAIGHQA